MEKSLILIHWICLRKCCFLKKHITFVCLIQHNCVIILNKLFSNLKHLKHFLSCLITLWFFLICLFSLLLLWLPWSSSIHHERTQLDFLVWWLNLISISRGRILTIFAIEEITYSNTYKTPIKFSHKRAVAALDN